VAPWVANPFTSLGTDGFGLSDTRGALRRHFRVDAESIVVATLAALVREGKVQVATLRAALDKYALHDIMAADPGNTEGSG
jgi:pyruvate dehydrogenase E1 component